MAIMIVKETSAKGSAEFELTRENAGRIVQRTGMDLVAIYTVLNSGQPIYDSDARHGQCASENRESMGTLAGAPLLASVPSEADAGSHGSEHLAAPLVSIEGSSLRAPQRP